MFTTFQILIEASRQFPVTVQTVQAWLNVTVTRNDNGPEFRDKEYKANITDDLPLGDRVLKVQATDKDNVSQAKFYRIMYTVLVLC